MPTLISSFKLCKLFLLKPTIQVCVCTLSVYYILIVFKYVISINHSTVHVNNDSESFTCKHLTQDWKAIFISNMNNNPLKCQLIMIDFKRVYELFSVVILIFYYQRDNLLLSRGLIFISQLTRKVVVWVGVASVMCIPFNVNDSHISDVWWWYYEL